MTIRILTDINFSQMNNAAKASVEKMLRKLGTKYNGLHIAIDENYIAILIDNEVLERQHRELVKFKLEVTAFLATTEFHNVKLTEINGYAFLPRGTTSLVSLLNKRLGQQFGAGTPAGLVPALQAFESRKAKIVSRYSKYIENMLARKSAPNTSVFGDDASFYPSTFSSNFGMMDTRSNVARQNERIMRESEISREAEALNQKKEIELEKQFIAFCQLADDFIENKIDRSLVANNWISLLCTPKSKTNSSEVEAQQNMVEISIAKLGIFSPFDTDHNDRLVDAGLFADTVCQDLGIRGYTLLTPANSPFLSLQLKGFYVSTSKQGNFLKCINESLHNACLDNEYVVFKLTYNLNPAKFLEHRAFENYLLGKEVSLPGFSTYQPRSILVSMPSTNRHTLFSNSSATEQEDVLVVGNVVNGMRAG
jgi:hypothetical protein